MISPVPRLVPAVVEQAPVQQPGSADVVGDVLDLGRLALALGGVLGEVGEVRGRLLVGRAELVQQRAVDDQIGVAADRAREMAVRGAGETHMAEVPRVVARLLQRAEDERRERLAAASGALDVVGHDLARLRCDVSGGRRGELVRGRRCRHAEVGELGEQQLDGLWVGTLVDAVERLAAPRREQTRDGFVRDDHQLLDQRVRLGLALPDRVGNAAWPSNSNSSSGRTTRSAPRAKRFLRRSSE